MTERFHRTIAVLIFAFFLNSGAVAQSSDVRLAEALDLAFDLAASQDVAERQAIAGKIQQILEFLVSENPGGPLAIALKMPGADGRMPVMSRVEMLAGLSRKGPGRAAPVADTCGDYRATILDIADRIIAEKGTAEDLSGSSFGTVAAYLKLRYQDMDLTEGLRLLEIVEDGDGRSAPKSLDELRLVFAIANLGVDEGLVAQGKPALEQFADFRPQVARQIILADAGQSFLRLRAELRARPDLTENFGKLYQDGRSLYGWLLDESDELKLDFARNAETAGELTVAMLVLGSRRDLAAYHDLMQRHGGSDLAGRAGLRWPEVYLATALYQTAPQPVAGDSAEWAAERKGQFDIMRAALRIGGIAWLSIVTNQTGETEPIARASLDFLAEVQAGRLQPWIDFEPAWVYLHGRLAEEMRADLLFATLGSFDLPRSVRHFTSSARVTIDWMIAKQALGAFVSGTDIQMPERPSLLSPDFDWAAWQRLAGALAASGAAGAADDDAEGLKIAAELLLAAGDVPGALELIAKVMPNLDRLWFYRDLMVRLDRLCDGYSHYPGAEIWLNGDIMYRFD